MRKMLMEWCRHGEVRHLVPASLGLRLLLDTVWLEVPTTVPVWILEAILSCPHSVFIQAAGDCFEAACLDAILEKGGAA